MEKIGSKDCKAMKGHTEDSTSIHPTFLVRNPCEHADFLHFKEHELKPNFFHISNFCIVLHTHIQTRVHRLITAASKNCPTGLP